MKSIILLSVTLFYFCFANIAFAQNAFSEARQAGFERGLEQQKQICDASQIELKAEFEDKLQQAKKAGRESCIATYAPQTKPGFGSPPKNAFFLALIASYISFAALKIVSISTIYLIYSKINKGEKISSALFSAATVVIFVMLYSMSGIKPIVDYYLTFGDKGTPFVGLLVYGLPTFILVIISFQVIWHNLVEKSKHNIPFVPITIFITLINIASFLIIDQVSGDISKIIYPVHVIYLSSLFAMTIFFAFKYKNGLLESLSQHEDSDEIKS